MKQLKQLKDPSSARVAGEVKQETKNFVANSIGAVGRENSAARQDERTQAGSATSAVRHLKIAYNDMTIKAILFPVESKGRNEWLRLAHKVAYQWESNQQLVVQVQVITQNKVTRRQVEGIHLYIAEVMVGCGGERVVEPKRLKDGVLSTSHSGWVIKTARDDKNTIIVMCKAPANVSMRQLAPSHVKLVGIVKRLFGILSDTTSSTHGAIASEPTMHPKDEQPITHIGDGGGFLVGNNAQAAKTACWIAVPQSNHASLISGCPTSDKQASSIKKNHTLLRVQFRVANAHQYVLFI